MNLNVTFIRALIGIQAGLDSNFRMAGDKNLLAWVSLTFPVSISAQCCIYAYDNSLTRKKVEIVRITLDLYWIKSISNVLGQLLLSPIPTIPTNDDNDMHAIAIVPVLELLLRSLQNICAMT